MEENKEICFMRFITQRLFNPQHAQHFGTLLIFGWLLAFAGVFPTVIYPNHPIGAVAGFITLAAPLCAHIYSLRALLALRREQKWTANMMAALWTLSYPPAALLCLSFARWQEAMHLPFSGATLALLSFGLLFPGLAPFLAYAVNTRFIRPHESRARRAIAALLFIAAWVLVGVTAEIIASV